MQTEIEAKWLEIDPEDLRQRLVAAGGRLVYPERLMKRRSFKDAHGQFEERGGWLRVRGEGDKITMSYKQSDDRSLHGTSETSVVVDDFDRACEFLKDIGMQHLADQETKREQWVVDQVEVTIDTWPWIPTFVEIEGPDEAAVKEVAEKLHLPWEQHTAGGVTPVYMKYYDVTAHEVEHWPEITFVPVPEWLQRRKR